MVLVVNDHVLKARWPGLVTGKLSDVAGLALFPLLLASLYELVLTRARRPRRRATPTVVAVCAGATAVGFTALKVSATARNGYLWIVELVTPMSHRITPDLTDLVTVPAVLVAWAISMGATGPAGPGSTGRRARRRGLSPRPGR